MTTEIAPAPAPVAAPSPRPRIFSGIQPSGAPHLGNDLGAIRNYVKLQWEYEAIYCIVDYHALTSLHDPDALRQPDPRDGGALIALGLDPERCTLFVQSHRPEATELAWLLTTVTPVSWLERTPTYKEKKRNQPDDVNHGLLTYPVLQAADIVIYKASLVPVGKDQAAHLELSREIVRRFNTLLRRHLPRAAGGLHRGTDRPRHGRRPEDEQVARQHDRHPRARPRSSRKQVMSMVTDTKRILRTDPGRPEVCNVCQLHRFFGDDFEDIWDGERTARTGCVDTKRLLAERIIRPLRRGARALRRADGRPGPHRRDPRRRRRTRPPDRRGDDGRGPREDGAALTPRHDRRPGPPVASADSSAPSSCSATIVLFFAAVSLAAAAIGYFGDILLTFFLAWLLAFIISPIVTRIVAVIPRLPRVLATVLVYSAIVVLLVFIVLIVAQALSKSITQLDRLAPADPRRHRRRSSRRCRAG